MGTHVHKYSLGWLRSRNGRVTLGTIIVTSILAFGIYMAAMIVPAYIDNGKLEEAVKHQVKRAKGAKSFDNIYQALFDEIETLGLDIDAEDISIVRRGTRVEISIRYVRQVRFKPLTAKTGFQFEIKEIS
ncbi:MAG: DUF4845 domain-containing protein [Deltaproteobacteria bacterium]|nr:DUF4845 domain-containing protein [Deltaproteobacteria bacterium]